MNYVDYIKSDFFKGGIESDTSFSGRDVLHIESRNLIEYPDQDDKISEFLDSFVSKIENKKTSVSKNPTKSANMKKSKQPKQTKQTKKKKGSGESKELKVVELGFENDESADMKIVELGLDSDDEIDRLMAEHKDEIM